MRDKERKRVFKKEISRTILIPSILSVIIAGGFCALYISVKYTSVEDIAFKLMVGKLLLVFLCIYLIIELLFTIGSYLWMKKRVLSDMG